MEQIEIFKTEKGRIYPTKTQILMIEGAILHNCQELYNLALQQRKDNYTSWKQRNKGVSYTLDENKVAVCNVEAIKASNITGLPSVPPKINKFSQSKELTELKKDFPHLQVVYDKVLRDVIDRVDKTFQAFFDRIKKGEKAGFPRYKSAARYHSFTYPAAAPDEVNGISTARGWYIDEKKKLYLRMGKGVEPIGPIRMKLRGAVVNKSKWLDVHVQKLTISKSNDGKWYVCFCLALKKVVNKVVGSIQEGSNPIALSFGVNTLVTLANGDEIANPRYRSKNEGQLEKAYQSLSRKAEAKKRNKIKETKFNCRNLKRARKAVAKCHNKIANQRENYLHKVWWGSLSRQ